MDFRIYTPPDAGNVYIVIFGTAYRDRHYHAFGAPWFQEKLIVALLRPFSTTATQSDNFLSAFDTHSHLIGL